jgi:hypothetical protein
MFQGLPEGQCDYTLLVVSVAKDTIGNTRTKLAEGKLKTVNRIWPVPAAARPKAWVCGLSLTGILGSNPAGGMDVTYLVSVLCCQVEVSESG